MDGSSETKIKLYVNTLGHIMPLMVNQKTNKTKKNTEIELMMSHHTFPRDLM